jgi:molybdopterin-containing oxidoreductase family iron-sulfur binding subunit
VLDLHELARTSGDPAEKDRLDALARRRELEMLERLQTACQQACPTSAIVFGDVNRRDTKVGKLKEEPHDYGLLLELTTRPRTTYLARISNPNPAAAGEGGAA